MSYTITITGETADTADETAIIDTVRTALESFPADAGITEATGVFDVAGTVDLAPAPAAPSVEQAEMDLKSAIDDLDPSDPGTLKVQNAYTELLAALEADPPAASSPEPAPGDPAAPDADLAAHQAQALAATAPPAL